MYLTNSDLDYIANHAIHGLQDLPQLETTIKKMKYLDWDTNEQTTQKQVLEEMERGDFLSACIDATFYQNTFRDTKDGKTIFFNADA